MNKKKKDELIVLDARGSIVRKNAFPLTAMIHHVHDDVVVLSLNAPDPTLFFFFSSGRRHTRSKRDWSSDVCSSDLEGAAARPAQVRRPAYLALIRAVVAPRSEERRVGKECRSRWSPDHEKKKKQRGEGVRICGGEGWGWGRGRRCGVWV